MGRFSSSFMKLKYTTKRPSSSAPTSYRSRSPSPSLWSSCRQPTTESFRGMEDEDVNKVVSEPDQASWSWFTSSSDDDVGSSSDGSIGGFSEDRASTADEAAAVEDVIRAVTKTAEKRILYEPVGTASTNSILEESKGGAGSPLRESTVVVVEKSKDPYAEFRASIREMAAAHGLHDLRYLRELLDWYLKVNHSSMHEFILDAFLDLLLDFSTPVPTTAASTPSHTVA